MHEIERLRLTDRRPRQDCRMRDRSQFLDLFVEDSWRNVYAGELEVRSPGAPTTNGDLEDERAPKRTLSGLLG